MTTPRITKVIIPAAGLGTRFLPQTKAMPKEMLPIVDKPVIQYVVEEALDSGIEDIVIITGWHKRSIEDHFDNSRELEDFLARQGKEEELRCVQEIAAKGRFIYIRQKGRQYGNAVPVLCAEPAISDDYFAVMWGDEFISATPPRLRQMLDAFEKRPGMYISAVTIASDDTISRYGIADVELVEKGLHRIKRIVEKPSLHEAPSRLATHGAYILPRKIFDTIRGLETGRGGELWLVDAINQLIADGFPTYALEIQNATYYDTGNKLEYLKTVVEFARKHPELGDAFRAYLKSIT